MLTGLWISDTKYQVTDSQRGKSEVITILATEEELKDFSNCLELEQMAREEVEQGWNKEDKENKRPYTSAEKKDLGGVLTQIQSSRKYKRENNHSRFW